MNIPESLFTTLSSPKIFLTSRKDEVLSHFVVERL